MTLIKDDNLSQNTETIGEGALLKNILLKYTIK